MPTLQEQKWVSFMDEVYADFAGAKVGPHFHGHMRSLAPCHRAIPPFHGHKKAAPFYWGGEIRETL
ncbi:MAG: hypothetical protein MK188_08390 [Gammaproteobacteria bacterium]|nr:hypothetical protein [Gammaproteobacteria bacterium]